MEYFIFEDNADDVLSKLYRLSFDDRDFEYVGGNAELLRKSIKALKNPNYNMVVAFIDVTPDNDYTVIAYNRLIHEVERHNKDRFVVIPSFCSEYYFIRSVADQLINRDNEYIKDIIEFTGNHVNYSRNFERACKLCMDRLFYCMRRKLDPRLAKSEFKHIYFNSDCVCSESDGECDTLDIHSKSIRYVQEFGLIPNRLFDKSYGSGGIDIDAVRLIRSERVKYLNTLIDKWSTKGDSDTVLLTD